MAQHKLRGEAARMRAQGMVSVTEAARLAGASRQTVYQWINAGKVVSEVVAGWRRYVSLASLAAHLGPSLAEQLFEKEEP